MIFDYSLPSQPDQVGFEVQTFVTEWCRRPPPQSRPGLIGFRSHGPAELFFFTTRVFGLKDFVFGPFRTPALLAFDFRNAPRLFTLPPVDLGFRPVDKDPARPIPVLRLRALPLAFDHKAGGPVL